MFIEFIKILFKFKINFIYLHKIVDKFVGLKNYFHYRNNPTNKIIRSAFFVNYKTIEVYDMARYQFVLLDSKHLLGDL